MGKFNPEKAKEIIKNQREMAREVFLKTLHKGQTVSYNGIAHKVSEVFTEEDGSEKQIKLKPLSGNQEIFLAEIEKIFPN